MMAQARATKRKTATLDSAGRGAVTWLLWGQTPGKASLIALVRLSLSLRTTKGSNFLATHAPCRERVPLSRRASCTPLSKHSAAVVCLREDFFLELMLVLAAAKPRTLLELIGSGDACGMFSSISRRLDERNALLRHLETWCTLCLDLPLWPTILPVSCIAGKLARIFLTMRESRRRQLRRCRAA